jgi:DNA-binding transcriptional regulator YhcF (GntR family)
MLFGRQTAFGGYNFTEGCRQVLAAARLESHRLRHEYVGTEHILLALIAQSDSSITKLFRDLGVGLGSVRRDVEALSPRGRSRADSNTDLPYTSRAKKVLELAMSEARELAHADVGAEHLLLGLAREEKGIAAQVLRQHGVPRSEMRLAAVREHAKPARPAFQIAIDDSSERSIYEQIVVQVQEAVATGQLRPGERLTTVRQLADELDIAPGTVARAYGELERLGVVVTEGTRGTRVASRERPPVSDVDRADTLVGLLRPVAVAAYHLGASAEELRDALQKAAADIFGKEDRDAA